jgi:hypothetical protein
MIRLDLSDAEAELLREIAEDWLSELRTEIAHTDRADFREGLKRKEERLKGLIERLGTPVA